ncbi:putative rho guanyl nucleotide exchange [Phaeomoniella chlamydospora]|uniref:Putative rho guanyl nucleotide exchange n=1 Tax=Phaeomoniella chlamydospora TaxID=158046 RepID=A0A0G2EF86_PHACM|nr:putative rho guanyl nucleotide exchange [Phaeomoniella chlamydospora]
MSQHPQAAAATSSELTDEDLIREIEAAVMSRPLPGTRGSVSEQSIGHRPSTSTQPVGIGLLSRSTGVDIAPDERYTHTNGHLEATGSGHYVNYGAFSDDSDAEAAAGLAAMQAADEQDAAERARRSSGGNGSIYDSYSSPGIVTSEDYLHDEQSGSDSDYKVDMGLIGGGYEAHLRYDDNARRQSDTEYGHLQTSDYETYPPQINSVRSSDISTDGRTSQTDSWVPMPTPDFNRPLPPIHSGVARVDASGTGGLTEPSPHPQRLSFEDGDEVTLVDTESERPPSGSSPSKEIQDLFYHPGMSMNRPLPPAPNEVQPRLPHLMPAGTYDKGELPPLPGQTNHPSYLTSHESYDSTNSSSVPRSSSYASARSTPRHDRPMRAKTDADKAKLQRQVTLGRDTSYDSAQTAAGYDLPVLKRNFVPEKITAQQFRKCTEPWALSSIVKWLKATAADAEYLKENALVQAIVLLFTTKVPTMNTTDAEDLGSMVVKEMFQTGVLIKDEEWVRLGTGELSGVLFQLTGTGCYTPKVHVTDGVGKCYSHHCMRTWKRVDLSIKMPPERKAEDWVTFYKLKKEDLEGRDKKDIERQNILHEIVTTEDGYIEQLDVLRLLYRDRLLSFQPPIIPAKRLAGFIHDVFGRVDELKRVNEDFLLGQLKYRQEEQGPWIVGFGDIFREWIRKAKLAYINYATGFPIANQLVRYEAERNITFRHFLEQARDDKRSKRLAWDTYLKTPITRLQRYGLLLQTVHKTMKGESEEKTFLQFAIDEIRAVTFECNAKVDDVSKKIELRELGKQLRLRKEMRHVELNLDHLGREVIIQGDLLRAGGRGLQWVDTRAILFDHYFVLAKALSTKDSAGGVKYDYYDVSKFPIPMDLLVLESMDDDPVVKSSVKGIGAVTSAVSTRPQLGASGSAVRTNSAPGAPQNQITHTNTNISSGNSGTSIPSAKSMIATTVLDSSSKDEKVMYPFRVKHLGKTDVYTLYAFSASNRQEWCEAIVSTKTRHASALTAQNAEPFRLRVLADTAFGYDSSIYGAPRSIMISGTPLDQAIRQVEEKYVGQSRPGPVCRAAVNCATVFNQPHGRLMCAVGTDYGVYLSEYDNPRGWARSIPLHRVSQVTVLEEFNIFLIISDKSLIAYPLDSVCSPSPNYVPQADSSTRRPPQKLSGTREVGFFVTGRMKDRGLVFYKKKDGLSSTFKVLEPVLQKSTTSRTRFLPTSGRRGHTEFFREYDEFYIPADCYSLNLFHSSLAISTSRGVEVLTLDKKVPFSVPILKADQPDAQAHLSSIASRIKDQRPLGMFRLSEAEFLVCFEECAVYVNKHGDVSRSVLLEFVGYAKSACLFGEHIILFHDDFVEIRNSLTGRLKQVISGRDIKCLDDGGSGNAVGNDGPPTLGGGLNGLGVQGFGSAPRSVKFCMQNPTYERSQIIVELLENDFR